MQQGETTPVTLYNKNIPLKNRPYLIQHIVYLGVTCFGSLPIIFYLCGKM